MPIILLFAVLFVALCAAIVLAPLGLIHRYRSGTKQRRARRWVAVINVGGLLFSNVLFLVGAAITNQWVPNALIYSVAGLAGGCLLGLVGLRLTRWENESGALNYTPNRLLILTLSILVAGRLAYGFWRIWQGWSLRGADRAWLEHAGIHESLAASAVILCYSLTFWAGMLWKIQQTASAAE